MIYLANNRYDPRSNVQNPRSNFEPPIQNKLLTAYFFAIVFSDAKIYGSSPN